MTAESKNESEAHTREAGGQRVRPMPLPADKRRSQSGSSSPPRTVNGQPAGGNEQPAAARRKQLAGIIERLADKDGDGVPLPPPTPRVTRTDARDRSAIVLVTATTARRGLLPHAHSGPLFLSPPRLLGRTRRSACATDGSPRVWRRRWTPSFCASLWRSSWRKWPSSWAWSHRGSSRRRLCACAASSVCVSWRNPRATVALH